MTRKQCWDITALQKGHIKQLIPPMSEACVGRSLVKHQNILTTRSCHAVLPTALPACSGRILKHAQKSNKNYEKIAGRE